MFMLFFADVSILARPPLRPTRAIEMTKFFLSLAVFW